MNVANRKCIRDLSIKNMRASRSRNIIAVIAIALTTVLFTSLFTIIMTVVHGFEQSNFRQVGGYEHCGLKYLTEEQFEEFKDDERIDEYGKRMFIGTPSKVPFNKSNVEISSVDKNYAKFTFADIKEGRLPEENTMEAAADTRVLSLLGIRPELNVEFELTFDVCGVETTERFVLCGWWEFDGVMPASNVFLPFSRGDEIFRKLGVKKGEDGVTGTFSLDMMLKSGTSDIENNIRAIIEDHGYQCDNRTEENYIDYGVNWGYLGVQADNLLDGASVFAVFVILAVIVFTGYLIIYNVFRISVSNNIRYYGLLKTIGTTGKQIKSIISIHAFVLSALGIPLGLMCGYGVGIFLTRAVTEHLDGINADAVSADPFIFIGAALFSLFTVTVSCIKPAKTASKISPVEAVRYTESSEGKTVRRSEKGASVMKMAWANLSRSRSRTVLTVMSLSLSVVLLNLTVTFAGGFDMDKYVRKMPVDFIISDAGYFRAGIALDNSTYLSEDTVSDIKAFGNISNLGRTFGNSLPVNECVSEEYVRERESRYFGNEFLEEKLRQCMKKDGLVEYSAQIYGMDRYCLDNIKVISGDISKLYGGGNYIAAVYNEDDYENVIKESHWAKVGDRITLSLADGDEYIFVDTQSGEIYDDRESIPHDTYVSMQPKSKHYIEYEVAAEVMIPYTLSYRYYSSDRFVLGTERFIQDTGTEDMLYIAFDVNDGSEKETEERMSDYTNNISPLLDYESKISYAEDFYSFRNMFILLGGVMSFIVGLVGVLNFINAVLTGMIARKREFAVLSSIGMTGRQLKKMLIAEGLYYTLGAAFISLLLFILISPFEKSFTESLFWFFRFKFTIMPVFISAPVFALLGTVIPLISYRNIEKRSVVERLRETE